DGVTLLRLQVRIRRRQYGQRGIHCAAEGWVVDGAATYTSEETFAQVRLTHVARFGEAPAQIFMQRDVQTDLPAVDRARALVVGTAEAKAAGDALSAVPIPDRNVQLAVGFLHCVVTDAH